MLNWLFGRTKKIVLFPCWGQKHSTNAQRGKWMELRITPKVEMTLLPQFTNVQSASTRWNAEDLPDLFATVLKEAFISEKEKTYSPSRKRNWCGQDRENEKALFLDSRVADSKVWQLSTCFKLMFMKMSGTRETLKMYTSRDPQATVRGSQSTSEYRHHCSEVRLHTWERQQPIFWSKELVWVCEISR